MTALRRSVRMSALLLAPALLVIGAACGSDDSSDDADVSPADLDGREFLSTDVVGHQLVDGSEIRLAFDDERLSANAGCNTMNGDYTIDGDVLRVEMMAMTEMGCEEALTDQDAFVSGFLTSGPTIALDGDELVLTSGEEMITFLDREVADPDRPLEGTTWMVESTVSEQAVSSVPGGIEATLVIDGDTANVDTGCNSGTTTVEVTDTTLTFAPMATTLALCEFQDFEDAVMSTLSGEVDYVIEADLLSLRRPDGSGLDLRAEI
ncbi:MAG: META domain-containing protein [Acidimicrobiia bacterium]|nr:META domain-containing protein [Acidimicrobiia bacterium]